MPESHLSPLTRIMLRMVREWGLGWAVLALTAAAVLLSVLITTLITAPLGDNPLGGIGLVIAMVVPAVLSPIFGLVNLRLVDQLERAREELRLLAITDGLTALYNRRHLFDLAEAALLEAPQAVGLVLFDLDGFKILNDTKGHPAGDAFLQSMAQTCRAVLPPRAALARFGGDEFAALVPGATEAELLALAERLRACIHQADPTAPPITASLGVALVGPDDHLPELITRADQALYTAKRAGGDRVVVAS